MFDILSGGVFGTLLGGAFRLFPEIMKFFDKKNEREHELKMFQEQSALEKVRGSIRLEEIGAQRNADVDVGAMAAFNAAITQQTEMVKVSSKWIADMSAAVRPLVTYLVVGLYLWFHVYTVLTTGLGTAEIFKLIMTPDFTALVSGTINYWFLDRTLTKRGL
jgi:hypothetical protein